MRRDTMRGGIFVLALVMCVAPLAQGKELRVRQPEATPAPAGPAPEKAGETAPARPFIERSLVLVPERVGDFVLGQANDYPGQPGSGVGLRYRHPAFPEMRLDLFVYPAGRVPRDEVVASAIAEVRAAVADAAQKGAYANLSFGEEGPFDLGRVDADGSLRPEAGAAAPPVAEAGEAGDPMLAIGAEVDRATDWRIGRRLSMRMDFQDEPQDSLAFVFYRGLYLYKGRISAPPERMPLETLERVAQFAMARLVPAVQVRSTGGCASQEVLVDAGLEGRAASEDLARKLFLSGARAEAENCAATLDETVPEGHRALPLVFDPAMWRSSP